MPDDPVTGMAQSLLREIAQHLERLARTGARHAIDLRSLPMTRADREELEALLGRGEVAADAGCRRAQRSAGNRLRGRLVAAPSRRRRPHRRRSHRDHADARDPCHPCRRHRGGVPAPARRPRRPVHGGTRRCPTPGTIGEALSQRGISRRSLLKYTGYLACILALPPHGLARDGRGAGDIAPRSR